MEKTLKTSPRAFEGRVASFFLHRALDLRTPALVGFSGGPDSTALLLSLVAVGAGPLRALYVDHGIRPRIELDAEFELIRSHCATLGLPLSRARVRPGAVEELARLSGEGLESAARRYRMVAFRRSLSRFGVARLYLAHNRDDRLETLLMRILGGAGAAGLAGMPPVDPPIFRPLLEFSKKEILAYLDAKAVRYSMDSTNGDESILRNRIRGRLIPLLERDFPGWERGLALCAEKAVLDEAALAPRLAPLIFKRSGNGALAASAEAFRAAPEALQLRALISGLGAMGMSRASFRLAQNALRAFVAGGAYRGGGIELRQDGSLLLLGRELDFQGRGGYFVKIDRPGVGRNVLRIGRLRVAVAWVEGPSAVGLKEDAFSFPLVLRSRRPGDAIASRSGRKALDELFSAWGIPLARRSAVPILEDREGLVAVLGAAFGGKDRYRHREGLSEGGRRLSIEVKGA